MKLIINNLRIPIEQDEISAYLTAAAHKLKLAPEKISISKILSKALDLKDREQFYSTLSLLVRVPDDFINRENFVSSSKVDTKRVQPKIKINDRERPIIVGFGPAGMFAALELIAHGLKPIIVERGKTIELRTLDVEQFIRERQLNPESNIQFGEGGAGSFSDGKLFSRRHNNSPVVHQVLKTFIQFGAPSEIEYIAKPHLGTDVLCTVVRNIRVHILEQGGEIYYNSRMTDILISDSRASGIIINNEEELLSSAIYLGLGHSARDTFAMLHTRGVAMEQKKISVGVRIEHPAETINLMRYGRKYCDLPGLGAATYSLNHTNRKIQRGVYTFCMCPGGEVVNASSAQGLLVLNGMSYSHRASAFSNGALVVSCHTDDYTVDNTADNIAGNTVANPLAGLAFQEKIGEKAFQAGGGDWTVPAQNLMNFLGEDSSAGLHENSYAMGAVSADMKELLPDFVTAELLVAFQKWRQQVPLFVSHQAILLGVETRTSSPVRITRNEHYESVNTRNLYPIGEGAGYTGGITSSAADAIKAVQATVQTLV